MHLTRGGFLMRCLHSFAELGKPAGQHTAIAVEVESEWLSVYGVTKIKHVLRLVSVPTP